MSWRLLDTGVQKATLNMAIDEALVLSCDQRPRVTLRFYQWARPTISLGCFQNVADVDLGECERRGFEWIRRPTGGRAVLHDCELTYSVVAPMALLGESVSRSHQRISQALALGLLQLGLKPDLGRPSRGIWPSVPTAVCFAAPVFVELTVQGKKIIGSAQMRTKRSILQHGSIPMTIDFDALAAVLKIRESETVHLLQERAGGLAGFLERATTVDELKQALVKGFEEFFNASLACDELSQQERALAEKLCVEKYATREWNCRQ